MKSFSSLLHNERDRSLKMFVLHYVEDRKKVVDETNTIYLALC